MRKYEEENYFWENIKESIYPWVITSFPITQTTNGKLISEKDTPLISFVGDLMIAFVIKRDEEKFEVLTEKMIAPEHEIASIYQIACENLVRDVEFVIGNTMYGAFGVLADGFHEASAICFKHIWNVCAEKLNDDLMIMVPSRDSILFAEATKDEIVKKMKQQGDMTYEATNHKISSKMYLFKKDEKELLAYEDVEH